MSKPTFTLGLDGKSITCHKCGATSHNANDVAFHYCGRCNQWHDGPDMFNPDFEAAILDQTQAMGRLITRTMPNVKFFLTTFQTHPEGQKEKSGVTVVTNIGKETLLKLLQGIIDEAGKSDCPSVIVKTE